MSILIWILSQISEVSSWPVSACCVSAAHWRRMHAVVSTNATDWSNRCNCAGMDFKPQFPGKEVLSMDIRHQRLSSGMSELKSCPWLFFFPL
ncbi:hypothetical protein, partial [Pseudomonas sp. WS 5503]|uniref:hypothetical protein n=1 Tax=Pseudomonas sp. WS 5503 TaxID=2717497 RepID=UPI001CA3F528